MIIRATGLYTVLRGTSTNASGDEVDHNYIEAVHVPLALHNFQVIESQPNSATPRVITGLRGRAMSGTDLRPQDRLINETSGQRYLVDTVSEPLSSTRNSDLGFTCHRVN